MWHTAGEAARLLGVSTETLREWERKFGYPRACIGPTGELGYAARDVQALGAALATELSVAGAIATALRRSAADESG